MAKDKKRAMKAKKKGELTKPAGKSEREIGFEDGLEGKPCVATSMLYVDSYNFGRETARIGKEHDHFRKLTSPHNKE